VSDNGPGARAALVGLAINVILVIAKATAGVVGHSYALVADAAESATDILSSLVVWAGLRYAARPADESHPYGHGKAESLTTIVVALMLFAAAASIAAAAVRHILHPHGAPAPFTLVVLAAVVIVKELLFRRVMRVADELGSSAVEADAWHHRSDAFTSLAALVGISVAVLGGPAWASADAWAALLATVVIAASGVRLLVPAVNALMDRMPDAEVIDAIEQAVRSVPEVRDMEKLRVRRFGTSYVADLHVQADPTITLDAAHRLSGRVKAAIRAAVPKVKEALIHMEPYEKKPDSDRSFAR
jgi:cation diffusion facilitator family transporter